MVSTLRSLEARIENHSEEETSPEGLAQLTKARQEAWRLLSRYLRRMRDDESEERASFGAALSSLYVLDHGWVSAHLALLLPEPGNARRAGFLHKRITDRAALSAWCGYLVSDPWEPPDLFELVRDRYEWSVASIRLLPGQAPEWLGRRLFLAYLFGHVDPNRPGDVLRQLLDTTPVGFRRHWLENAGRTLRGRKRMEKDPDSAATSRVELVIRGIFEVSKLRPFRDR